MLKMLYNISLLAFLLLLGSCSKSTNQGFSFIKPSKSGVRFNNEVPNSDIINILSFEYIYNGAGVGTADFNKDGNQDLFFAGNFVENALYLNEGNFSFKDISSSAGITGKGKWCTGVSIVDINNDSWPDIYVSVNSFNTNDIPNNLLFIHQGLDENEIPSFKESAIEYGVQGGKHSMHAAFFDYDLDGDLDLYLLNNVLDLVSPTDYRHKQVDGDAPNNDQLLRNNGKAGFSDVSKEAGIMIEGYGLGIALTDINKDGYPDIYIANDYITNDLFYINQKDGSFKNEIDNRLAKQSKFSMGVATADFNNDLKQDLFVLDMLANTNYRLKTLNGESHFHNNILNKKYNYGEQNVRNMLQINDGDGEFIELAFQAGVFASDWSWTPLCEDFDLDGDIDIYATNGFPKDITDLDFINYKANRNMSFNRDEILSVIPEVKISNIYFENQGDLSFIDQTKEVNLSTPSFSNGAISVDLDNDGDLDIVTNNINQEAFIIENHTSNQNWVKLQFDQDIEYSSAIGAKIYCYSNGDSQYKEYFPHQSYISSSSSALHFGLGSQDRIDSVVVEFANQQRVIMEDIEINSIITITKERANAFERYPVVEKKHDIQIIELSKNENLYFDANLQTTIPTDYSHSGPKLLDTNLGMIAMPGGLESPIFISKKSDSKLPDDLQGVTNGIQVDLNNDGLEDLIFTKASYQNPKDHQLVTFINTKGAYIRDDTFFNGLEGQHSIIEANDIDNDGDIDLFFGGGYIYGQYPLHHKHYIAINQFTETGTLEFELTELTYDYAIMDASWQDIDRDGNADLIVAGHWSPISVFSNENGKINAQPEHPFGKVRGLWNKLFFDDFNNDGAIDLIAGNQGYNTHFQKGPLKLYAKDFDNNGTIDPLVFSRFNESKIFTPMALRDELINQVPIMKKKYLDYTSYANATDQNFFTDLDTSEMLHYEADQLGSMAFISSDSNFTASALPFHAQIAPIYIAAKIKNTLFLGGNNSFGREFWGSNNASHGHWLTYNNGEFSAIKNLYPRIKGDLRDVHVDGEDLYISRNDNTIIKLSTKSISNNE